jgi:drug/metabolite transporter (DMT)-like permease
MDITFEDAFAGPRGGTDPMRRLRRSAVAAMLFGSLALWGATTALAEGRTGGFVHQGVGVTTRGGPMFSLPALAPGQTLTRHATVSSSGPAHVRLYAAVRGTGLARFLTLTVTRGGDVLFSGPLSRFPRTWAAGVDAGTWTAGERRTFVFEITLSDAAAAQGLRADADFRWEARPA